MGIWFAKQYNSATEVNTTIRVEYRGENYFLERFHGSTLHFSKDSDTQLSFVKADGYNYIKIEHNAGEKLTISVKQPLYADNDVLHLKLDDTRTLSNRNDSMLYPWSDKIKYIMITLASDDEAFQKNLMDFRG